MQLVRALRELNEGGDLSTFLSRFGHRARYDLDPDDPRYWEQPPMGHKPPGTAPSIEPPALDFDAPAKLDQRWNGFARDLIHDAMARQVARIRVEDSEQVHEPVEQIPEYSFAIIL